jgi:methylmalonyl-CoA epimerase
VAVRNLDEAMRFYVDALGLSVEREIDLPESHVKLVRLGTGDREIELMQATDPDGAVARFIERHGEGLHHVSIEVEDIELELRTLLARGAELIDREPRSGPDGRVAFVSPRSTSGVLIELFERIQPLSEPAAPY